MNENLDLQLDKICSDVDILMSMFSYTGVSIGDFNLGDLPDLPGLYCVSGYWDANCGSLDSLFYIGVSTTSIRGRWSNHHKMQVFKAINCAAYYGESYVHAQSEPIKLKKPKDKSFKADFLSIYTWSNPFAPSEFLLWLEKEFIKRLNPPCNNLSIGRNKDSDLKSRLVNQTGSVFLDLMVKQP